jgi:hypothetical protein
MIKRLFALFSIIFLSYPVIFAQNQEKPKTIEEMAIEEAVRLEKELKLEPHQAFYIDSILQHDMKAMDAEMQSMKASGIQDYRHYEEVRKRWVETMKTSFQKVLTEEQYIHYLKDVGLYRKEKKAKEPKKKKK